MFKQQQRPAGYVNDEQFGQLKLKLRQAGYEDHDGLRVSRSGEVAAFRRTFHAVGGVRQNHVQIVDRGVIFAIYAHTEPHTARLIAHAISALGDGASFSGGSKMLRNDLADAGYRLLSHAEARASARRRKT